MEYIILRILVYYWTVTALSVHCSSEPDYCNETVYGPNHVMCLSKIEVQYYFTLKMFRVLWRFHSHKILLWDNFCERKVLVEKLQKTTKLFILHAQNTIRQIVALGQLKQGRSGPQPPAANMKMLVWSDELELMAQQWASTCRNSSSPYNDQNRNTSYYYVNQLVEVYVNLTVIPQAEWSHPAILWAQTIYMFWFRQSENVSTAIIDSYREPKGADYRSYTQMVWAKTEAVGCAYTRMRYETEVLDTLVCNYGPGGNVVGEPIYISGQPLSQCDNDTYYSVYYRGLCQNFYYRTTPYEIPPVASMTELSFYIGFFLFYLCLIYYLWLSQRYGRIKNFTTGTGKLLAINEKEYVLAHY